MAYTMKCYCWRNGDKKCAVCVTRERAAASTLEVKVGRIYSAAKPTTIRAPGEALLNDRQVKWISADGGRVQYDGPAVANGRHYPTVSMEQFKAWAAKDVTDEMPAGEWRSAERRS